MSIRTLAARGLSFAHLAGLSAKAKAEDDKPEDEDKKDAKAEGDEPEDDEKKEGARADEGDDEKKDAKAEDDEDDAKAEDEDGKKEAKADDGDDDNDEEMRGNSASAKARRREQARCAAIFASKAAARNPVLAANLAFNTRMSRQEALAILESTPAQASHSDRSARNPNIGVNGAKQSPQQAMAARWDQNLKAANPSRR
ncbi:hypothetical protein [Paraburkholderia atlantica]|uniref:hypothetical protein n=1 Tax=Paraburkholderia atlantica TaxID=2654982 RepID=UPI00160BD102|nr:hypothetical protein [Paraburkholderia atlantica]MBB5414100.1 hypothetical protein [Paraburkholderia atlantica]